MRARWSGRRNARSETRSAADVIVCRPFEEADGAASAAAARSLNALRAAASISGAAG
jgi:hypothetical protein